MHIRMDSILTGAVWLSAALALPGQMTIQPIRTMPKEVFTVKAGFRDWSPATLAGSTLLAGNQTGRGGMFAIDTTTGKLKWSFRPSFDSGTAAVSVQPAVDGHLVITPFATAYPGAVIALSLATGKELWRGPDPIIDGGVALSNGAAYVQTKSGEFVAMDAATGRPKWTVPLGKSFAACPVTPLARDGLVVTTGMLDTASPDGRKAGYYLFAFDTATGQERWRYRAEAPYEWKGVCLRQPVLDGNTLYASGQSWLYAIDLHTGRDRWKPIEARGIVKGSERSLELFGLTHAGNVLVAISASALLAFDKNSGHIVWQVPGTYREVSPSLAVAGNVLYFQGSPAAQPAPAPSGTLYALDLDTQKILWSFSRPTAEPNWSFGTVVPIDNGLWVDSYLSMIKLQQ